MSLKVPKPVTVFLTLTKPALKRNRNRLTDQYCWINLAFHPLEIAGGKGVVQRRQDHRESNRGALLLAHYPRLETRP